MVWNEYGAIEERLVCDITADHIRGGSSSDDVWDEVHAEWDGPFEDTPESELVEAANPSHSRRARPTLHVGG